MVEGIPGMEEGGLGQDLDERIHERDLSVVGVVWAGVDWNSAPVGKITPGGGQAQLCWGLSTFYRSSAKSNDESALQLLQKRNPHFIGGGKTPIRTL